MGDHLKLIVHADDFGLTEKVNEGILQAHLNGVLTSASIIANGSAFDHAISLAKKNPTLDIGVHFTLVEERPLRDHNEIKSLTNVGGNFHGNAKIFMKKYLTGQVLISEVKRYNFITPGFNCSFGLSLIRFIAVPPGTSIFMK